MPNPRKIVIVCLPDTIPTDRLDSAAITAATSAGVTGDRLAPAGHFPIRKRRTRRLLQPVRQVAAGGPIHLLHLDAMEAIAGQHAWHAWTLWSRIVRGTQPAQPFWRFADRHRQDPTRYPPDRAQQDYLAQPRIQAMSIYNAAMPAQQIPTGDLEALQVNCDAYVALARMRAIPGAGVVTLGGVLLAPANDGRLSTLHGYVGQAQRYLHSLSGRHQLVALTTG